MREKIGVAKMLRAYNIVEKGTMQKHTVWYSSCAKTPNLTGIIHCKEFQRKLAWFVFYIKLANKYQLLCSIFIIVSMLNPRSRISPVTNQAKQVNLICTVKKSYAIS